MIRHVSSTPSWRVKRVLSPTIAACSSTSYGVGALAALVGELHVERRSAPGAVGAVRVELEPDAGRRVELDDELVRLDRGRSNAGKPSRGGCLNTSRSSVCVTGSRLPVRMKNGTPDQRQFSISSRSAAYVSVVESGATPSIER